MALDKFSNTGLSTLASGIDASQLTATLAAGTGSRFPADTFNVVLWDSTTFANPIDAADREIVRCTSRAGDVLTIVRGQEGTTGVAHNTAGKTYSVALIVSKRFRDSIFQKVNTVVFTAAGTYMKPANLVAARIIAVAGAGAGGGATATDQGGAGGGSGSYAESFLSADEIGASVAVAVGAGGVGGTGTGGNGGDSSFGTLVVAKGGTGGQGGVANRASGGNGGIAGTGDITIPGNQGQDSELPTAGDLTLGGGGPSALGGGIRTRKPGAGNFAGLSAAANTGAGGGGANADTTDQNGGNGGSGIVIVHEFLNELI